MGKYLDLAKQTPTTSYAAVVPEASLGRRSGTTTSPDRASQPAVRPWRASTTKTTETTEGLAAVGLAGSLLDLSGWSETEASPCPEAREQALRFLACWLVAAARKGAPAAHLTPVEGSQNSLDVAREAKVGSKSEAGEMAVQQALQRDAR